MLSVFLYKNAFYILFANCFILSSDKSCTFTMNKMILYTTNLSLVNATTNGKSECEKMCLENDNCMAYLVESGSVCYQYKQLLLGTTENVHESYEKKCSVKQCKYSIILATL